MYKLIKYDIEETVDELYQSCHRMTEQDDGDYYLITDVEKLLEGVVGYGKLKPIERLLIMLGLAEVAKNVS